MGATLRSKIWLFASLLVLGGFVQACTNQSSSNGPSFPAGQTGTADTTSQLIIRVVAHRAQADVGDRIGLTVLVTNSNGRALEGRHVQLGITNGQVGRLDQVDGFTDADGKFVTFLFCNDAGAPVVAAFVEGATSSVSVTCGAPAGSGTGTGTGSTTASGTGTRP
jgi:Big-like domain-containing protein